MNATTSKVSRRRFTATATATAAAATAASTVIPASALGRDGRPASSDRIVMGIVGWGMMGPGNTQGLMAEKGCLVVAACDLYRRPLKRAVEAINKPYDIAHCKAYHDYREMMARDDIDAAMLVGRKIKWDAKSERIIGDDEAAKLLSRDYRGPWMLSW